MDYPYLPQELPLNASQINSNEFITELVKASSKFEVYKEKVRDSKLDSSWFMPTLQQKEALASSMIEGTQATLDGVLANQVIPNEKDKGLKEVTNYFLATNMGYKILSRENFSDDFFCDIHKVLMNGSVRNYSEEIARYRTKQNYICKRDKTVTYIPPKPELVESLMKNLIEYMNHPNDSLLPLVRTAIIHAQFETIHPFMDGNGRVGRILIPMYLYAQEEIDLPCFFISEALEKDKLRYYSLLTNVRKNNNWNDWIKFFLVAVANQCEKHIKLITEINKLYEKHLKISCSAANSNKVKAIIDLIYQYPVITTKQILEKTHMSPSSMSRYLALLVKNDILETDEKSRHTLYVCYDLLSILRS